MNHIRTEHFVHETWFKIPSSLAVEELAICEKKATFVRVGAKLVDFAQQKFFSP
jgi:hypothetical protein